jgi:hypothetical protein
MTLRGIWGRLVSTNYIRALEREVTRLRAENRALLNSILGIAGVPPIVVAAGDPAAPVAFELGLTTAAAQANGVAPLTSSDSEKSARFDGASALSVKRVGQRASAQRGVKGVAAPMRRRSWHQSYRMLEIDAARKKEAV